jgi:putative MATE family efflux protein
MKSLIGDKKFYQRLIAITVPIILQQLITSSVQLVDNIMVGQLAEIQSNAVFVVNQIYFVLMLITFGVMSGAGIYSAQYYGAKDFDKLKQTFRFKLNAGIVVGLLSFLVFTFLQRFLISNFTDESVTIGLGMSYMNTIRWAIIPFILSIAISSTFREIGIVKPLLYISIVAIFTNTVLNYILIFGHLGFDAMGTDGAAIATLIARCVEFLLMVGFLMKRGIVFKTKLIDLFKINKKVLIAIVAVGAPLTLNEFLWSMGQTMFVKAYSERGTNALGAMYITNSVSQLVFVTFGAWATGIAVMVGNTLGENRLDIAKDNAKKLIFTAFAFSIFTGVILFGLSYFIVDIFQFEDITKSWASFNIRVNALFIPLYSLNVAIYFTLRSGGDMRSTVMMDSGFMWVVSVPVALSLAYFTTLPITLMFLLVQSLEIPKSIFGLYRYKKEYWLKNLAKNDFLDELPVNNGT